MSAPTSSYCPSCFHAFVDDPERCPNLACRRNRPRGGWLLMLSRGDLLDRNYRVEELVAVGGAGVTYRARELGPDGAPAGPDLAVKVLHSRRSSGAFLQRLANEARILQELRHDHIVECLGFSQRKGAPPYLVTRFERGGTLEQWTAQHGKLPPWTVAGILRQVFEGLAAAHKKGVVHRDLKPANLLLGHPTPRNEIPHVRIADFGIAKVTGKLNEGLTRAGAFIGTPRYAAPEQFSGAAATPATDVFAGGALAIELLTGEPWLEEPMGGDLEDWHEAALQALPPVLPQAVLGTERALQLQALLRGTMHPDPAERWNTAEVIEYLDFVLGMRAEAPEWLGRPREREDRLTEPGRSPDRPPPPKQLAPDDRRSPAPRQLAPAPVTDRRAARVDPVAPMLLRNGGSRGPAQRTSPRPSPGTPGPRGARDRMGARASIPRPSVPRPAAAPASSNPLVARRAPTEIAGDHPGDRWAPTAPTDQGGGMDLDRIVDVDVEVVAPGGRAAPAAPFEAPPVGPISVRPAGDPAWYPVDPAPLPAALPGRPADLMRLLAAVNTSDRRSVTRALVGIDPTTLESTLKAYRPGEDAGLGRGVALTIELLRRRPWEPIARSLLSDPEPGVRSAAAAALGRVGQDVRSMETLGNLLQDPVADVRVAAIRALSAVAVQSGRQRSAAYALRPLLHDSDPRVQDAAEVAMVDLE